LVIGFIEHPGITSDYITLHDSPKPTPVTASCRRCLVTSPNNGYFPDAFTVQGLSALVRERQKRKDVEEVVRDTAFGGNKLYFQF
jgi:hypothetical protein